MRWWGSPEWAEEPRFLTNEARVTNRDRLIPLLSEVFATREAGEWLAELAAASVPCAPIRSMDEVFASPEGAALVETVPDPSRGADLRLVYPPIRFGGRALRTRLPPPTLGEHTPDVLGEP